MLRYAAFAMTVLAAAAAACTNTPRGRSSPPAASRPSILLVTLDTTRADAVGPGAPGVETPAFNALAARGRYFRHAYATAPETLPAHASMLTGLYAGGHGVHENARVLDGAHKVIAEELRRTGYRTAAFVSSFVLSARFGLSRGFELYDDEAPAARSERSAVNTTERALAWLSQQPQETAVFMWVHYFDPHAPYEPAEPFRSRYAANPYLGEVAAVDEQLGRLTRAFEARSPAAVLVAGDHGEGLGDHGEAQHGNLVYQSTMRVPMVMTGPGVTATVVDQPVSTRRVFHTISDWAGIATSLSLRGDEAEMVLGEAMKPFLEYGWQPQTMAVGGHFKAIQTRTLEAYDLAADPGETRDLGAGANLPPGMRKALDDYPIPLVNVTPTAANLDEDARRRLASLGYVSASAAPPLRPDAPRPARMTHLFEVMEKASGLFVQGRYADAIPLFEHILAADPGNLDAMLRVATAHSLLGHADAALAAFKRAARAAPQSADVRTYLGLHYARVNRLEDAAPLLEQVIAESPGRVAAIEGLASVRERQGRVAEALALYRSIAALRPLSGGELIRFGQLAMSAQETGTALEAFEKARTALGPSFSHDLELGVLYLSVRRLNEAGEALDRVGPAHRDYAMALFKRAQVSVLLRERDSAMRIEAARRQATPVTRQLILNERLFRQ